MKKHCPKCGSKNILVIYEPKGKKVPINSVLSKAVGIHKMYKFLKNKYSSTTEYNILNNECLLNRCSCGYDYITPTLDNTLGNKIIKPEDTLSIEGILNAYKKYDLIFVEAIEAINKLNNTIKSKDLNNGI